LTLKTNKEENKGQVKTEPMKWKELIADLSVILKKFPGEVAQGMTLFQAIAIRQAEYRMRQFEAGVHGIKLDDIDNKVARTPDGKQIATEADLNELLGLLN